MRLRFFTNIIGVIMIVVFAIAAFLEIEFPTKESLQANVEVKSDIGIQDAYGVSAAHPLAVHETMKILEAGGNVADAFVTLSFMLNVVEPYGSGIGGGGALLYYTPDDRVRYYDYREVAPAVASHEQYDSNFGVPGFLMGVHHQYEHYGSGTFTFAELIQPAKEYAREGIEIDSFLAGRLAPASYRMNLGEVGHFFTDGQPKQQGDMLIQEELAQTIEAIQQIGPEAYFKTELAQAMQEKYPMLTQQDFDLYEMNEKEPVVGEYRGNKVFTAPAPLAGPTLLQLLKGSEYLDFGNNEGEKENYLSYTEQLTLLQVQAYNERLQYIADPDTQQSPYDIQVQLDQMISDDHIERLVEYALNENPKGEVDDSPATERDHNNTTHFVIVDQAGHMISATHTLSNFFGSGDYYGGFFLNDQLSNFNPSEGSINGYAPGKRPRSFLTPTIVIDEDRSVLGIGSPGGARIPNMIAQTLIHQEVWGEPYSLEGAINQPRFHYDNRLDRTGEHGVFVDMYYPSSWVDELEQEVMHYGDIPWLARKTSGDMFFGGIQALKIDRSLNLLHGGADSRRGGTWQVADTNEPYSKQANEHREGSE